MKSISHDFRQIATAIPGAEGPLVTRDGRIFLVASSQGSILEITPDGKKYPHAQTGGVPAGLQLDRNGDIWVADMRRGILRVTTEGTVIPEVTEFDGKPIRGCNDLIFDHQGNLYFTAPAGSNANPGGAVGQVFFRGRDGDVRLLAEGFAFPNGIAVSKSGALVIFAETFTHKLVGIHLSSPGSVAELSAWAVLPGNGVAGGDGMDFDVDGNLVATNYSEGTLEIYDADARFLRSITLPFKRCSNVHFLNDGSGRLLVTEHENNALWIFDYGREGQLQYGWS